MKKILVAVALVSVLAATVASAAAPSYEGKWGFSLNSSSTPVGVTFGIGKTAAFDLGVGFSKPKNVDLGYAVQVGVRSAICSSDNANIFVRGFGDYSSSPYYSSVLVSKAAGDSPKYKTFGAGLQLGFEWWPASNVSVYARHGVEFSSSKVGDGESSSTIGTNGETLGAAGFVLWWGK